MELYLKVRRSHFQDGLSGRQIAREFGISRNSVRKTLAYSEPPGYRRAAEIKRPKLDAYVDQIDQWLMEDKVRPRNLVLPRFSSGFFRAMFTMKEIENGNEIHRRVSP